MEMSRGDVLEVVFLLVPAAGVEPATFRSGGERSNPLSYAGLSWRKDSISHKEAQKAQEEVSRSHFVLFVPFVAN